MDDKKRGEVHLEIHMDEETAQGVYVNLAVVNHTDTEFTLDFIFVQPQVPKAKVRSRIVTSPKHIKRLIAAMQENLQHFEAAHGQVTAAPESKVEDAHYH